MVGFLAVCLHNSLVSAIHLFSCDQLVPHIIRLMNSPIESIRASGFNFAIEIISQKPQVRLQPDALAL